jgi:hypothetical protein
MSEEVLTLLNFFTQRHHQTLSLSTITNYGQELQEYTEYLDEIADALVALFMWRGTVPVVVPFTKWTFKIPLHSMIGTFTTYVLIRRDSVV